MENLRDEFNIRVEKMMRYLDCLGDGGSELVSINVFTDVNEIREIMRIFSSRCKHMEEEIRELKLMTNLI